jgi:hypothetical protein
MMDNTALEEWIDSVLVNIVGIDLSPKISLLSKCCLLTNNIFGIETKTIEDLHKLTSTRFGIRSDHGDDQYYIYKVVEICLLIAVSSECIDQSIHIENILAMDASTQSILMNIIKESQITKNQVLSTNTLNECAQSVEGNSCGMCSEKDDIIFNLRKKVEALLKQERESESKYKNEIAICMNRLVDAEVIIL